jgi:hypothetical protein
MSLKRPKITSQRTGLNEPDRGTIFGDGTQGYTDYPFLADIEALRRNY